MNISIAAPDDGRLHYAGRASTGMTAKELAEPPPRDSRFGSPLQRSKVHWMRPEVVPKSQPSALR